MEFKKLIGAGNPTQNADSEAKLRNMMVQYLKGEISLTELRNELKSSPRFDLVRTAAKLDYRRTS